MRLLSIALLLLPLAACTNGGTRPCGSFDLPAGEDWATVGAVGETATYRDAGGESLSLTLLSREDNAPYEGYDRFGSDEVVCRKSSTRRYLLDGRAAGLTIELRQFEALGRAFEDQPFFIGVTPEAPVGTALRYGFLFDARDPATFYGEDGLTESTIPRTTRALSDVTIGETRYAIAVESVYTDAAFVNAAVPADAPPISGVVFAEGGGLVRLDYASGERFVRVGPPRP